MLGEKLKAATTRCVLRPVDFFSGRGYSPGPARGAYSTPPDPIAGFGDGNRKGGMERAMG